MYFYLHMNRNLIDPNLESRFSSKLKNALLHVCAQSTRCMNNTYNNIVTIDRAWNRSANFRITRWLKIITNIIRSYYRCCCINEPVIFSQCVHLKLGRRFYALLKVCSDRDDIVPFKVAVASCNNLSGVVQFWEGPTNSSQNCTTR